LVGIADGAAPGFDPPSFLRYPPSQWKSLRTTNAIERLHEEFKRRIKTQCVLPTAETACMLFWALLACRSRRVRGDANLMVVRHFGARGRWMALNRAKLVAGVAGAAWLALSAGSAVAAEGGSSFYLLGQRSQGAGILPPEGVFFSMPNYIYSGDTSGSEDLPFGGSLSFGVDADTFLTLPTAIWVTPVDVLGGDLALTGTFVLGHADVNAAATLAIPGIGAGTAALSDERWAVGDPAFGALVGWHAENFHYLVSASANVPVGDYEAGRLSNISLNRWAGDITGAATWLNPEIGIELSGAAGVTFNGENDETDYETGTELHVEAAAVYHFSPAFSAGVNGYHYQQLSGDSGRGATLGDFEGRVTALGPTVSANFQLGQVPVAMSLRYFHEFNVRNRLEGDSGWLTISIPLWVPDQES